MALEKIHAEKSRLLSAAEFGSPQRLAWGFNDIKVAFIFFFIPYLISFKLPNQPVSSHQGYGWVDVSHRSLPSIPYQSLTRPYFVSS